MLLVFREIEDATGVANIVLVCVHTDNSPRPPRRGDRARRSRGISVQSVISMYMPGVVRQEPMDPGVIRVVLRWSGEVAKNVAQSTCRVVKCEEWADSVSGVK